MNDRFDRQADINTNTGWDRSWRRSKFEKQSEEKRYFNIQVTREISTFFTLRDFTGRQSFRRRYKFDLFPCRHLLCRRLASQHFAVDIRTPDLSVVIYLLK